MGNIKEYTLNIVLQDNKYEGLVLLDENLKFVKYYKTTDPIVDWYLFMLSDKILNNSCNTVKINFFYEELITLIGDNYYFQRVDKNGQFTTNEYNVQFRVIINIDITTLPELHSYYKRKVRALKLKNIL